MPRKVVKKEIVTCGAKNRAGVPCRNQAGHKTDHLGEGRCTYHGGSVPVKHGRYSKIKRARIRELQEQFEADPDPTNLLPEVSLLRAIVVDFVERYDEIYGPDGALIAWHSSFKNPLSTAPEKPRQLLDFSSVSALVDRVGAMVDRIRRAEQERSISLGTLNRVIEQLGLEVHGAISEMNLERDARTALLDDIERRWGSVRLEPDRSGAGRAPTRSDD